VSDQESDRHHRSNSAIEILESVELLATQDPEAFGELVVKILCKLAELDRDTHEYLMGVMISRELRCAVNAMQKPGPPIEERPNLFPQGSGSREPHSWC